MIYASLTAYGETGPERDREGFDLVAYWARTGLMDLVRTGDVEPAQSLPGMGDHPTAVALYAAIVTALLRRERTGARRRGQYVAARQRTLGGIVPRASETRRRGFFGWRTSGACRDHASRLPRRRWPLVAIHDGANAARDRSAAFACLGLGGPARRCPIRHTGVAPRERCRTVERMRDAIALRNRARDWLARVPRRKVPGALVGTLDDLLTDPQLPSTA